MPDKYSHSAIEDALEQLFEHVGGDRSLPIIADRLATIRDAFQKKVAETLEPYINQTIIDMNDSTFEDRKKKFLLIENITERLGVMAAMPHTNTPCLIYPKGGTDNRTENPGTPAEDLLIGYGFGVPSDSLLAGRLGVLWKESITSLGKLKLVPQPDKYEEIRQRVRRAIEQCTDRGRS